MIPESATADSRDKVPTAAPRSRVNALKDYLKKHRNYWIQVAVLACFGLVAEHLLGHFRVLLHERYEIYSLQTRWSHHSNPSALNTVFVAIDDDAFWTTDLARRLPLKREYIATLMKAVADANPRVIALDFDLRSPIADGRPIGFTDYDEETKDLLDEIKEVALTHKVVLAESIDLDQQHELTEQSDIFDHYSFGTAGHNIRRGYVQFLYDLRTIPLCATLRNGKHLDSFSLAMLHASYPDTYRDLIHSKEDECDSDNELDLKFGQFVPSRLFENRTVSSTAVLAGATGAKEELYGGVVVICGTWHQRSYKVGPTLDMHDSPAGEIPGAYIHANYFEALQAGHYFGSFSDWAIDVIELCVIFIAAFLMLRTKRWQFKILWAFLPALVMIVFSYFLLQNIGAFFECTIPVIVLLSHAALDKILEWRRIAIAAEESGFVYEQ